MLKVEKPNTHGDKLKKLLVNSGLPDFDRPRIEAAIEKYHEWINKLDAVDGTPTEIIRELTKLLNDYKYYLDFKVIFSSEKNFLYRQKGQLKLDNTVLEEFLPRLFDSRLVPGFARLGNIECGPRSSFAGLSFDSPFLALASGGAFVKLKDQDFSVTKPHKLSITEIPPSSDKFSANINVCYFATEIKTNLDKTMFQEASMTASELKRAVSGSKYILLCEWLDMTPINTKLTPIDEVIVLRKAKRLSSNVRKKFSNHKGRGKNSEMYQNHLKSHPIQLECIERFVAHLNECFPDREHDSADVVLERGYF